MSATATKFAEVQDAILFHLYVVAMVGIGGGTIQDNELGKIVIDGVPPSVVAKAYAILVDEKLISLDMYQGGWRYEVTAKGLADVEGRGYFTYMQKLKDRRDEIELELRIALGAPVDEIRPRSLAEQPGDGDDWSPLPIDRKRPEYTELVEALEDVHANTREDNGYSITYPDERDSVVQALEVGIGWLRNRTIIFYGQLDSYLISPLKRLMHRFGDAAVGVAAKKAVEALWKYFFGN